MMILLAALTALGATQESEAQELARVESSRSPVRLWMSNDRRYREGDRVRIQVDADADGFLLVLNYDPTGRLRVLFPLDPRDDTRIEAGRRYEVRSEGANAAFRAGGDGTGFVYTAVADEPWRFDEIVLADRWDLTRLELDARADDPEPEITELVQRLAGPRGFDYDVMGYRVYGEVTHTSYNTYVYPGGPTYVYDDYLFCNNWNWRYDGCRRWPYDSYWSFSLGYYRPYHYGYYGYYSPYRYGYGYGYPYFPSRPSYFPVGKAPVLVGRPRGYTVVPRGTLASGFRGSRGSIGSAVTGPSRGSRGDVLVPDSRGRARGPARPAREVVGRDRPTITSSAPEPSRAAPPARRSRGSESRYSVPDRGSNRTEPSRGADRSEPGRGFSRPERVAPAEREAPRARGESPRARGESSRREPPQRVEPSRREAPAVRRDPPAARRDPPAQRAEPVRRDPPSRSRSAEPRRDPPRAQAQGGGNRGGQSGAQRGGGGGGGGRSRRP